MPPKGRDLSREAGMCQGSADMYGTNPHSAQTSSEPRHTHIPKGWIPAYILSLK